MADFTSDITTIASLKDAFEHVPTQEEAGTDNVVNYEYTLQNDLDFNNENYWFKESDFFYCNHTNIFVDTTILTENKTFYLNNKVLSNIYLTKGVRLFALTPYDTTENSSHTITFYDGTFEVISNDGTIFDACVTTLTNPGNNHLTSNIIFKNCVFNVKLLHNVADSDNSSSPKTVFQSSKSVSQNTGKINMQFVNCVFNIEYTTACTNRGGIMWIYYANANIQSCEFRIKDRSASLPSYTTALCCYSNLKVTFNNNVIFYDSDTVWSSAYLYLIYTGTNVDTSNNFLGSFYTYDTPIAINFTDIQSIFYDSDKFSRESSSGTVVVGLPTADCKNATALEAAGYVFAHES